jgi:hypothetical protein
MEAAMLIQGEALSSGVQGQDIAPFRPVVASVSLYLTSNHNRPKCGLRGRINAKITFNTSNCARNNPVQP